MATWMDLKNEVCCCCCLKNLVLKFLKVIFFFFEVGDMYWIFLGEVTRCLEFVLKY